MNSRQWFRSVLQMHDISTYVYEYTGTRYVLIKSFTQHHQEYTLTNKYYNG